MFGRRKEKPNHSQTRIPFRGKQLASFIGLQHTTQKLFACLDEWILIFDAGSGYGEWMRRISAVVAMGAWNER